LLEGSISNIAFVTKGGDFIYPSPEKTIKGTTLKYAISLIEQELVPTKVKKVSVGDINLSELATLSELFHLSNEKVERSLLIIGLSGAECE
jgi:branched-subunit amino acid aminotransferase/4-amino-4-deoxychorismate lyase